MADTAGAQSESATGRDPLDYWLAQERHRGPDEGPFVPYAGADDRPLHGGWWLLPVLAMAVPVWTTILWTLLRG